MDQSEGYQDEVASIGTNSYSIVSKRSVEKLYYPNDPAFLKPFVPKFKRRAPLINRGYWLRTRAIESAVERFLVKPGERPKVVINLGCGYDPLPFRMKFKKLAGQAKFIDVDYPDLIERKLTAIREDSMIREYVDETICEQTVYGGAPITNFQWYCLVGCDLGDIETLSRVFEDVIDIINSDILFVAEVSVTYMPLLKANRLIQWTASHEHASMVMLEQIIPAGPDHPFAKTMLAHFAKQTPLQSIFDHQTLAHQRNRFKTCGYQQVDARSLWDFWEDGTLLTREEKTQIDKFEPFDEWEEFILYASHYVILNASDTEPLNHNRVPELEDLKLDNSNEISEASVRITRTGGLPIQNVGASLTSPLVFDHENLSQVAIQIPNRKSSVWNVYGHSGSFTSPAASPTPGNLCHTLTKLDSSRSLLAGGRFSPSKVNSSCYTFDQRTNSWTKVQDLPHGRFRHCAIRVLLRGSTTSVGLLIFGGRTVEGTVLADWLLWTESAGWMKLKCTTTDNSPLPALFGASITDGILFGGLDINFKISHITWNWSLKINHDNLGDSEVVLTQSIAQPDSGRFGAFITTLPNHSTLLIGGVSSSPLHPEEEVMSIGSSGWTTKVLFPTTNPRPFLICNIIAEIEPGVLFIAGGGGVCFSFGSCFNNTWYLIAPPNSSRVDWKCLSQTLNHESATAANVCANVTHKIVPISLPEFKSTVITRELTDTAIPIPLQPMVFKSLSLGTCLNLWTPSYLASALASTTISIHNGSTPYLRFTPTKNFNYQTCQFSDFAAKLEAKQHVYLRALAGQESFKRPADFYQDFAPIAQDFIIPEELQELINGKIHSSVLRVTGNVVLWVHYDVMSNFYFQIQGSKKFVLFPPEEALNLQFLPGETASPVDTSAGFAGINHKIVVLNPGDTLFIPRFWAHATYPEGEDSKFSVAINVFWRDLDNNAYAFGKDVYGNRDLGVYEWSREAIQKIVKAETETGANSPDLTPILERFSKLPKDVRDFYIPRIENELVSLTSSTRQ